jgi:hypothetical protein
MRGRWTFDPFHAGWVELHPVRAARIIAPTAQGYPEPLPLPTAERQANDDEP